MPYLNKEEKTCYKSILIKESDNTYLGWEPYEDEKHPIGAGMKKVEWNKSLPEDIDTAIDENGNSLYKYENGELKEI
jgi:hypothetical protein